MNVQNFRYILEYAIIYLHLRFFYVKIILLFVKRFLLTGRKVLSISEYSINIEKQIFDSLYTVKNFLKFDMEFWEILCSYLCIKFYTLAIGNMKEQFYKLNEYYLMVNF